jgi:hypothetical protein
MNARSDCRPCRLVVRSSRCGLLAPRRRKFESSLGHILFFFFWWGNDYDRVGLFK